MTDTQVYVVEDADIVSIKELIIADLKKIPEIVKSVEIPASADIGVMLDAVVRCSIRETLNVVERYTTVTAQTTELVNG